MEDRAAALTRVAALCSMLAEALDELEAELASTAFVGELRDVCTRANDELARAVAESRETT